MLGPRQQAIVDALAAAGATMTVAELARALGRPGANGARGIRAAVDALERRRLVKVERVALLRFDADGGILWRAVAQGETPDFRRGDPVPGRPGDHFTTDVVRAPQARPVSGSLVTLTPEGQVRAEK